MAVSTDTILDWLEEKVKAKQPIPKDAWSDAAFKLVILLADEHLDLENYRALVAADKLKIYQAQEKKSATAADMEVEAGEHYRQLRLQEHRVQRVEELIRLAKLNMNNF